MRDLAWACFSPSLLHIGQVAGDAAGISACALQITAERRLWLEGLDRDATALTKHLALRPTHRLGIYYEQLWHFFLQQDPYTELIAHNLPVHQQGTTLGEFDCIYYCLQRECHVHLELAVKYFLGIRRTSTSAAEASCQDWVGPDNRDRLDLKLNQLLQRQILLSQTPAAKQTLCNLGVGELTREVALKGYLFQPDSTAPPPPPGYNHDCKLSHWVVCDQIESHCAALNAKAYLILPKMRWLCAARCGNPADALTRLELQSRAAQHFRHDHYPLLIAALDQYGSESSRFFVTPEHWPESNPQPTGGDT